MLVIGEKLNASIKKTKEAIEEKNIDHLRSLAKRQEAAGSNYIDVNVGTGKGEAENMKWLIEEIEKDIEIPLAIDTADEDVLRIGLETTTKKPPIVNSVTAETRSLGVFLPYVKQYDAMVIALAIGEQGVPSEVEPRIRNCGTIAEECEKLGIPQNHILFDPLIIPQSTEQTQCMVSLETISRIKEEFPEAMTCIGLSNISFGLPKRRLVNATFIAMAMAHGLDAAIINPLDKKLMTMITAAEMLVGRDRFCKRYIRSFRDEALAF